MDRIIYTAMTGANAAQHRQSVLSNNLANVSTNGFRAELSTYRAVPLRGEGATTRVFALEATAGQRDAPGPSMRTGRDLDAMPQQSSWFAVQGLDGGEAYTRNGSFEVSPQGVLQTSNGLPLLSDGGSPITVPENAVVSLGSDGTISAQSAGQPPTTLGRIKLATPTEQDRLKRGDDGLFRPVSGGQLPSDTNARMDVGVLEGSNVNAVETMVGMIQTARQFEQQMRMLQTAESDDRSAAKLLSLEG
ncbi:flagellar basal body rod protein FlgF [Hylemonella gracilis]|uniref:Flagellar basal-body rod protein FlgF n=1 Tax=Hylemonella gracilis ATCC 19624 TaxID=887062 RepID=F3KXY6_9BURK|nr:flagellar basal body rod protein FlgF [Hylemonella gracilis]EGI75411.1 flagellar basal-body rod protein FlgF [Hylemonella gracilis ATCC 19624]